MAPGSLSTIGALTAGLPSVASLPQEAQNAAVAGGRKQLQQAARQVREQKQGSRAPKDAPSDAEADLRAQVAALREKVDVLTAENTSLKEQLGLV